VNTKEHVVQLLCGNIAAAASLGMHDVYLTSKV